MPKLALSTKSAQSSLKIPDHPLHKAGIRPVIAFEMRGSTFILQKLGMNDMGRKERVIQFDSWVCLMGIQGTLFNTSTTLLGGWG